MRLKEHDELSYKAIAFIIIIVIKILVDNTTWLWNI